MEERPKLHLRDHPNFRLLQEKPASKRGRSVYQDTIRKCVALVGGRLVATWMTFRVRQASGR